MPKGNGSQGLTTAHITKMLKSSFCGFKFNLEWTGYFNSCQINAYLLAIPQLAMFALALPQLVNAVKEEVSCTRIKSFKMLLASLHVVVTSVYGPLIFSRLSITVSYLWLFTSFLSAFMELNGYIVPNKALLGYYFICAFGYGYYVCAAVAKQVDIPTDPRIHAATFLFLTSFANAAIRDIGDAMEHSEQPVKGIGSRRQH